MTYSQPTPSAFSSRPLKGRCYKSGCKRWASHELLGHPGNVCMAFLCEQHAESEAKRRTHERLTS